MKTDNRQRALRRANKNKNDEFYTMYKDIEKELNNYKNHLRGQIIYCNCDNPSKSNFVKYFIDNFDELGIKSVIATHYIPDKGLFCKNDREPNFMLEYNGEYKYSALLGNGDFRSNECIRILKHCDIVITNPPFSLFRDFVGTLIEYNKKFIIIGNQNAITYKEVFPLLRDDKVWLGYDIVKQFIVNVSDPLKLNKNVEWDAEQNCYIAKFGNICWFTNLEHNKRNQEIILFKKYNKEEYPTYDNYNAINIDKVKDIPYDYDGFMGVPITFMNKYNPNQFEILGIMNAGEENPGIRLPNTPHGRPIINGEEKYLRILIKRKK